MARNNFSKSAEKPKNRWGNLIILIVIIVIIAGVYLYFQNGGKIPFISMGQTYLPLDEGYAKMISAFEKNNVDLESLKKMSLIEVDDNGSPYWVTSRDNILLLRIDLYNLLDYYTKNFSPNDANELIQLDKLYMDAVDLSLSQGEFLGNVVYMGNLIKNGTICDHITEVKDLNATSLVVYSGYNDLKIKSLQFKLDYNLYAEPILVDMQSEYDSIKTFDELLGSYMNTCKGGLQ
ncbi:MAG: hypothetical protein WCW13_01605 [archaeon]|jgi:hypothetical protein